jgi:hypothetical protein
MYFGPLKDFRPFGYGNKILQFDYISQVLNIYVVKFNLK